GQKTAVTLTLTPAADAPLALFEGSIAITGADTQLDLGFQIRTVSSAFGDLQVSVEDEYTYFATEGPRVAGATVLLRDPFNNTVVVAEGTTDASGQMHFTDVPEGTYLFDAQAPKHASYRAPVTITAGVPNTSRVFISRQAVSFNWNVTPGPIADTYNIRL